ncbi:MAG: TVP38/TMEM64 family protein [Deltaproteobacteria bacterium]|nr:MAG: TVP38/TMEM64 family protein [Deltaproteobacteria bacterium]
MKENATITAGEKGKRFERSSVIRALVLLAFITAGIVFYRYTDYSQYLTKDKISFAIDSIRSFVARFGLFGPILFVVAGFIAITTNIPTVVIIYFSVITFGGIAGAFIAAICVYIATTLIYFIAQLLGRDFVTQLFGKRLKKLEGRLDERGLMTVIYLRLIFFMSPPLNWLLSLTNISYRNFFLGTLFGTVHHIIINAWLSDMIIDQIKAGGSLNPIETPKLLIPLGIGVAVFITVRIIDRRRRTKGQLPR